ncbi:hypothetical protein CVT26_012168 [Gymnopilus dilepis]|uniref:Cytochrome P450 n=1 Tax=Gymnopilus dilepis TaxID=231916 RepID=A0A409WNN4_9AGAR|nr:hypothetical protein CVT26_012168 [Gymnopilus dilepis]
MYIWTAVSLTLAGTIFWTLRLLTCKRGRDRMYDKPPGPPPLPIVGNVFDFPRQRPWETFSKWAQDYGKLLSFLASINDLLELQGMFIFGRPLVILNSLEAITDLLIDRSAIYSDRPYFPLLDIVGHLEANVGFMPYGKEWTALRKVFASGFSKSNLVAYYDSHRRAVMNVLKNFRQDPSRYEDHFKLHAVQLVIDVTYGIQVDSIDHHLVNLATRVIGTVATLVNPLTLILDPKFLGKILPRWMGGGMLSRRIDKWKQELHEFQTWPYEQTKSNMARSLLCFCGQESGAHKPSFTSHLLQEFEGKAADAEEEKMIRQGAAAAYIRYGEYSLRIVKPHLVDSVIVQTSAAANTFLLAMLLYPEVQQRAQKEIDSVVGVDRLPDFKDRQYLPYVDALLQEVLRWHSPTPLAMPHLLRQDDHYRGFHLPAGSIVIGNAWNILHDPSVFSDPFEFQPERHLYPQSQEVAEKMEVFDRLPFGFGRRLCPGKAFAEDALWLLFAQFLAVFNVLLDSEHPPAKAEFTSGPLSHAIPFHCKVMARSEEAKLLLEQDPGLSEQVF